jgi:RHS repeat-associated protein
MAIRRLRPPTAAVAIALLVALAPPAAAAPSDPFFAALPARDTQAPDALSVADSDGSVDASTGSAAYKIPIVVPPGRKEMAPSLALSYSSQRPLRGGIAVGWELDIGSIEKDPEVLDGTAYRVDWNGISERLIAVSGDPWTSFTQTFRARRDASFTRFTYSVAAQAWTAYTLDGKVHTFAVVNGGSRWHLSQSRDRFGNRIDYIYQWTTFTPTTGNTYGEQELIAIEYSSNPGANLAAHARVDIVRSPIAWCGAPVGAALDHHFGVLRAKGSRAIDTIDVKVKPMPGAAWQLRRRHRLVYDAQQLSCSSASALRYLSRFEVTAYDPAGAATVVPPVLFTYGAPTRALDRVISAPSFGGGERGTSKGPTSMLLDLDDDGWLDRVTIAATSRCNLVIQRGTGVGTFAGTSSAIPLPSATWSNGASAGSNEGCTLSGQVVDRGYSGGSGPACRKESAQVTYRFQDWDGDGLVDLVTHLHETTRGLAGGDFPQVMFGAGGGFGSGNTPPSCSFPTPSPEMIGDNFLLRVQRNLGAAGFEPFVGAMQVSSPVPMPMSPSQLNITQVVRPGLPSLVDVTGDGFVDAVSLTEDTTPSDIPPMPGAQPKLFVWPGTGGTSFGGRQDWPFQLPLWNQQFQVSTWNESAGWFLSPGTVNVNDLDGDGLADLVVELGSGQLAVVRNTGGGFRTSSLLTLGGPVDLARTEFPPGTPLPTSIITGARAFLRQLVDTDADGLPEHLVMGVGTGGVTAPASSRTALHIFGTRYAAVRALGAEWEGLEELVVATSGNWRRASAVLDVTGDGIVDLVEWSASGGATIRTDAQDGLIAPRKLTRVYDGRGGVTEFQYVPSTDASTVVPAGGHLSARHVVRSIVVSSGDGQPPMTTRYTYAGPRHGRDHWNATGRPTFLGFTTVTTDRDGRYGIGSSRTVQQYAFPNGYDLRALLTEEWTLMRDHTDAHVPVRMRAITTQEGAMLNGASSFRYASATTERTCAAGATMATCTTSPERTRVTTSTWTPYRATPTGPVLHFQETRTDDTATLARPRTTTRAFSVRSTTTEYMQATTDVQELDGATLLSREVTVLDGRFMPAETRRFQDALTIARTQRGFDEVGNLYIEIRPTQVASDGLGRWLSYDAHRVLAAGETNELWHTTYETRDLATGVLLERRGPNWRYGTNEQGVQAYHFETERSTIDGLGRVVRREATFDPPAGNPSQTYVLRTTETTLFDDVSVPNREVVTRVQDTASGTGITTETQRNSTGRVTLVYTYGGPPGPAAVTRYFYDAAGDLRVSWVPDPRVDTGATVEYWWHRDGLGRPSLVTRPDGSGEAIYYEGATTRIVEIDELGQAGAIKRLVDDGRGALREVHEHGNAAPTVYAYDALGRLASLTSAEGHVTSFGYDLDGHRTSITRGTRVWRVRYNLDGDPVAQEAPFASGTAADHTTVLAYDALRRVTRREPASLGQPLALRTLLGIGPTTYTYDTTRVGSLGRATYPFGTADFTYDARGKVRREARSITPPGASYTVAQHVDRTYDATGAPRDVTWDNGTTWQYAHDNRGDLAEVMFRPPNVPWFTHLAIYTRGVAGVARSRNAGAHRRDWTYDALGRILTDRVWWSSTGATQAERTYGYHAGQIDAVWGQTAGMDADATYAYDAQDRLTGAVGPGAYNADFGYSPAGNVTRARVSGALDVAARDVTYRYAAFDPQAVEALVAGGADVATLTYDVAGTLRQRSGSLAPPLSLTWDGDEQVREAVGPGGTERYLYGERGQRIAAMSGGETRVWFAESETRFNSLGGPLVRWFHVAAGDEPLARLWNGISFEIQHADALRNLMVAVDNTGTVTAGFLYGAFGEVVAAVGAEDHRRQWNGKEADVVTGLRHYGFRNYDPLLLRWVSADPAYRMVPDIAGDEPQRANLYAFSLNNAMFWVDPDGLESCHTEAEIDAPPRTIEPTAHEIKSPQDQASGSAQGKRGGKRGSGPDQSPKDETGAFDRLLAELGSLDVGTIVAGIQVDVLVASVDENLVGALENVLGRAVETAATVGDFTDSPPPPPPMYEFRDDGDVVPVYRPLDLNTGAPRGR